MKRCWQWLTGRRRLKDERHMASYALVARIQAILRPHGCDLADFFIHPSGTTEAAIWVIQQNAAQPYYVHLIKGKALPWKRVRARKIFTNFVYLPPTIDRAALSAWITDQLVGASYQQFWLKGPVSAGYSGIGHGPAPTDKPGYLFAFETPEPATLLKLFWG